LPEVLGPIRGEEAWRYDTLCALCRASISSDELVYVVGMHVFHKSCLEWLLKIPEHRFKEVLKQLPLDTHEPLKKLRSGQLTVEIPAGEPKPTPTVSASESAVTESVSTDGIRAPVLKLGKPSGDPPPAKAPKPTAVGKKRLSYWEEAKEIVCEALKAVGAERVEDTRPDKSFELYKRFVETLLKLVAEKTSAASEGIVLEAYYRVPGYDTRIDLVDHKLKQWDWLVTWRPLYDWTSARWCTGLGTSSAWSGATCGGLGVRRRGRRLD